MIKICIDCSLPFECVTRNKRLCDGCKKHRRSTYALRHPVQRMLTSARFRAKNESVPFDISESDIAIPEYCPVLGIKLKSSVGQGTRHTDFSPSLDKIVPNIGYVKGNVVVMSSRANRMKSNGTVEEHRLLVKWLEDNHRFIADQKPEYHETAVPFSKPKNLGVKSDETRQKMRKSQALRWANQKGGKIQKIVDSAIQQIKNGNKVFIATISPLGYVTRFKLAGITTEEVDGGVLVKPDTDSRSGK